MRNLKWKIWKEIGVKTFLLGNVPNLKTMYCTVFNFNTSINSFKIICFVFITILSFLILKGGSVQFWGCLHSNISLCPHHHNFQGSEQSSQLPGNQLWSGVAKNCLHCQLRHVSHILKFGQQHYNYFKKFLPLINIIVPYREIDGQNYAGDVKEKEKAKTQYEKAVSKGQSAGLIEYAELGKGKGSVCSSLNIPLWWFVFYYNRVSGRKMEKFTMSVNVAAGSNVTFILTYEELLKRTMGQYEILTRIKMKQPVERFKVEPASLLSCCFCYITCTF